MHSNISSSFSTTDSTHSKQHCNVQVIQCNGKLSVNVAVLISVFHFNLCVSSCLDFQALKSSHLQNFGRAISTTGLFDQLETACMKKGEEHHCLQCIHPSQNCHQNLYMKSNMFSKQSNIILQTSDTINHNNFQQLFKPTEQTN